MPRFKIGSDQAHFECALWGFSLTQDGYVIRLAVHPDEVPDLVLRNRKGARFMIAMVAMSDDPSDADRQAGDRAVARAALLCRDSDFQAFAESKRPDLFTKADRESATSEYVRLTCGVTSRSALRTSLSARERLGDVADEFESWRANPR